MKNPEAPRIPSLDDFIVRYDPAKMHEEARQDYLQGTSGAPRLLAQKDIAARFQKARRNKK